MTPLINGDDFSIIARIVQTHAGCANSIAMGDAASSSQISANAWKVRVSRFSLLQKVW